MPTNPIVRREILGKLNISRQALSYRAKRIKEKFGPMTTEEAVYVIAHIEGIDLSKYLPISTLDRMRSLVPKEIQPIKMQTRSQGRIKQQQKESYPLTTSSQLKMANDLGCNIYPKLFVLENSIRSLITNHFEPLGVDWWDKYVPPLVKNNVTRTINKEKRFPYRESRGNHPLSYANFSDLCAIILENKIVFQNIIINFEWFKVRMDEIYMARNNLAHCVPLLSDDVVRINLFFRDWSRLLEVAGF